MKDKTIETMKGLEWFSGQIYDEGGLVTNPLSGQSIELNNVELSIYDFVMGCNFLPTHMWDEHVLKAHIKGLDYFIKNNVEAYMVLLD